MRTKIVLGVLLGLAITLQAAAQTPPRLVRFSGVVRDASGQARTGPVTLTFNIYADAEGGTPLWAEPQAVTLDAEGRYTVVLGATQPQGLPLELFTTGAAHWLAVQPEGQVEQPRVLLVSVPYAMKAADADTIAGKPVSAFVLTGDKTGTGADGLTYVNPKQFSTTAGVSGPLSNSGTANYLGMFTGVTDLTSSVLYQAPGTNYLGVGTSSPLGAFHSVADNPTGPGVWFDTYSPAPGYMPVAFRMARGTKAAPTAIKANDILGGLMVRGYGATGFGSGIGQIRYQAAEDFTDANMGTYLTMTTTPTGSTGWAERMRITAAGFVGIGTSTPTARLHVAGDAVVDGNIAAKYQDVAEWVESSETLAAGMVVVVDPEMKNGVRASRKAYDVGVAGAVSAQPGVTLGEKSDTKALVAQSGRVRVKVDARYGAIKAGDLLVTSPTPGYAMKSKPLVVNGVAMHRPGTIVGKALEPLKTGKGEILVLLTLQ